MKVKQITEKQLSEAVARLNAKVAEAAAKQDPGFAQQAGNIAGQVAGAPVAAANWVGDKIGGAWNAAKQGVQNFATGFE